MTRKFEIKKFEDKTAYKQFVIDTALKLREKYNFYLCPHIVNYNKDLFKNLASKDYKSKMTFYFNSQSKMLYFVVFCKNIIQVYEIEANSRYAYAVKSNLITNYNVLVDELTKEEIKEAYQIVNNGW